MTIRSALGIGAPRAAHGFNASQEIKESSDLTGQVGREKEYEQMAAVFSQVGETLKSLADAWTLPRANGAEPSYLRAAVKSLAGARKAVFKAETASEDDADDEDEDGEDCVEKAEKLLAKAKRALVRAEEEGEDEAGVEKTQAGIRKVAKDLKDIKDIKDKKATAKAAPTAEAAILAAKAQVLQGKLSQIVGELSSVSRNASPADVAKLSAKIDVMKGSLKTIIDTVAGNARAVGTPPNPALAKAVTVEPVNYARLINQADAAGALNRQEVLQAKVMASRLNASRGDADALAAVDFEIRHAPAAVKAIFAHT